MRTQSPLLLAIAVVFAVFSNAAAAGPCDAYFLFDNSLADAGGNGYDGEMIGARGTQGKATFVEGKYGQALQLDGTAGMRALIDLHWDSCPQVTFSAWINVSRDASSSSPVLFSTGQSSGPGLYFSTNSLRLNGTENGISVSNAVRPGSWQFVAGVYDFEAGTYELYWGSRQPTPGKLSEYRYEPENAIWVGTENDNWGVFASGVAVDELRIVGRALDAPEVMELRTSLSKTATSVAGDGTPGVSVPAACYAQSDCSSGSYCAVDNVCYPNSQLPMDHAAATATPGDRSGIVNPNPVPGEDMIPDLSAGQVMAGRWVYSIDALPGISGGNLGHTVLEFSGRDNALSGTVSTVSGDINQEPMTSVTMLNGTISFTSPSYGSWSGRVSGNGSTVSLSATDRDLSPRLFVKRADPSPPSSPAPGNPQPDPDPASGATPDPVNSHVRPGPTGVRQYSALSGVVGDEQELVELENGFMTGILWGEALNRPCELWVKGWQPSGIPTGFENIDKIVTFGTACKGMARGDSNEVQLDRTLAAIGRIQVCNNVNNNWRLKGIRIWGDAILDDGSTTYIPGGDEVRLPNCEVWQSDVLCPSGTHGTGLRVHTKDASGDREQITGLELICRRIVAPGNVN